MIKLHMPIRNVAIIMLMVILITPAIVHAHTVEILVAESMHANDGGCHDAGSNADHETPNDHEFDVHCCGLDIPYVLPSSQYLTTPAIAGLLTCFVKGRQLDGYFRRIFKPPRVAMAVIDTRVNYL